MSGQGCRTGGGDERAQVRTDDPMVRITSMPLGLEVNEVMAGLSDDVSRDTGLDKNLMTYYWQTFDAVYCPALKDAIVQHPVFVDLYVPGFMTDEVIAGLMISLAASLEKRTAIPKEFVFIHTHVPKEGHIYIAGNVAKWEKLQSGGPQVPSPRG